MIGTILNERFSLDKELGRGGMGAVYRATDQVLQRTVAIKVLMERGGEEVGKKIRLEAQILARLLHDNIVRIYDFGASNGTYYLVMEEVTGSSYARRWRLFPLVERLRIIAQVADALDYAHHQGVIHRDVKPANVLLTEVDQVKLSDFGLSTIVEQEEETGAVRGTASYMSPEQAQGLRLDYRTDLYALGIMLYESVTGAVPFRGPSREILAQHIHNWPEPPSARNPEISPTLEALILALLAKDPEQRPVSGAAVAEELRKESEHARQTAATTPPVPEAVPLEATTRTAPVVSTGPAAPRVTGTAAVLPSTAAPRGAPPLAKAMLETILAEPVTLSPEERFLYGHYLAYLLGGSRRRGILLRRPLDPRNADRARLILAMTWLMHVGASPESIARAAELLERRPEVRPSLNPVVMAKYLAARDTPAKRKRFRQARGQLQEASPYAQEHMTGPNGVLNPGLIPQKLDDLRRLAPDWTEVDDQLVGRWNRVAEVWRDNPAFRKAVLRYATREAERDPASIDLWPEVVYPLIERARWQRQMRTRTEAILDDFCARVLHIPDAGVQLDRAIEGSVPAQVVEQIDHSLEAFEYEPRLEDEPGAGDSMTDDIDRITARLSQEDVRLHELAADQTSSDKGMVRLAEPNPHRFLKGQLRELWQEAAAALRTPRPNATVQAKGHRIVPVGPYRLAVIPSIRGRSASQVVIQGMPNKQVEMLTPTLQIGGSASKPIVAVWVYRDQSLAIAYLDSQRNERYILWHAPTARQINVESPADLNHELLQLGLEAPDQLDRVLTKRFRPHKST